MHSFDGFAPPPHVLRAVEAGEIAAFCLFTYQNVQSPDQVRECTDALRHAAGRGGQLQPIIAIDQEGGQLIAIRGGATELPGNMALGATRSPELAYEAGRLLGRELLAMGINMNLAPCLDVNINPANPAIGIRSFGDDPDLVAEMGSAFIRGLQSMGVVAVAKHFPGHGDTAQDTHHGTVVVAHDLDRVQRVELAPFRAAIAADVGAILTAHIRLSAVDDDYPATLSPQVLTDLLRKELGFGGLIITDAMDMYAVAQYGEMYSVLRAIDAGADLVLLGHLDNQTAYIRHMRPLARPESVARIEAVQRRLPQAFPSLDVVGCAEHQRIAQTIADKSITLVRGALPLTLEPDTEIAIITPRPENLTPADTSADVTIALAAAVEKRWPRTRSYELLPDGANLGAVLEAVRNVETVIVGTVAAERAPHQAALVRALHERAQNLVVIAMRTPYDITAFPMIETYVCCYGIRPVTMEAVARALFGEITPSGVLPCAIPSFQSE